MEKTNKHQIASVAVIVALAVMPSHAIAQTSGTWLGTSGAWSDTGVWSGGIIADGTDATADFTGIDITTDQLITLNDLSRTIGNINFSDDTTSSNDLTITGSNALTLSVSSGAPAINVAQNERTLTIASDLITSSGLDKQGSGTLRLTGSNTYSGTTLLRAGTLIAVGSNALGTGLIDFRYTGSKTLHFQQDSGFSVANQIQGGRIHNLTLVVDRATAGAANDWTFSNQLSTANNSTLTFQKGSNMTSGTPTVQINTLHSSDSITNALITLNPVDVDLRINAFSNSRGRRYVFSGSTTGNVAAGAIQRPNNQAIEVIKDGTGTWTFTSGSNTYFGNTTINSGTLALGGSGSINDTPQISVAGGAYFDVSGITSGTYTLGASQVLTGSGTVVATGKTVAALGTISPGSSPGTLTQDGGVLQLGAGGNLNWQIHNASGAAGVGLDTVELINGATLDLSLISSATPYNLNLWSLSGIGPDANGDAIGFDPANPYTWALFSTDSVISGFDPDAFAINIAANGGAAGFSNVLDGGSFGLALTDSGTDLSLTFTPIPEPATALLGGFGLLLLLRRRRCPQA